MLEYADLSGADLSYCDLRGAHLENANLNGTILYPAETIKAKFCGAKFLPDSDAAEYAQVAQEEMYKRTGIKQGSVAYKKLQRINGWDSSPRPEIVSPPIECRRKFLRHTIRIDLFIFREACD
jgi:Pentapeptide repeats (8 copies)